MGCGRATSFSWNTYSNVYDLTDNCSFLLLYEISIVWYGRIDWDNFMEHLCNKMSHTFFPIPSTYVPNYYIVDCGHSSNNSAECSKGDVVFSFKNGFSWVINVYSRTT